LDRTIYLKDPILTTVERIIFRILKSTSKHV